MEEHFKYMWAKEELVWLNTESHHLAQWITDEASHYTKLCEAVNFKLIKHLIQIQTCHGYTGLPLVDTSWSIHEPSDSNPKDQADGVQVEDQDIDEDEVEDDLVAAQQTLEALETME
ncbi:hypothetical protein FRB95_012731 [Tulasnella sp. JGI-2019a]|nr:hypothetical protein FRB95_012731 [Tulasnella sp. JGI-2019a]